MLSISPIKFESHSPLKGLSAAWGGAAVVPTCSVLSSLLSIECLASKKRGLSSSLSPPSAISHGRRPSPPVQLSGDTGHGSETQDRLLNAINQGPALPYKLHTFADVAIA